MGPHARAETGEPGSGTSPSGWPDVVQPTRLHRPGSQPALARSVIDARRGPSRGRGRGRGPGAGVARQGGARSRVSIGRRGPHPRCILARLATGSRAWRRSAAGASAPANRCTRALGKDDRQELTPPTGMDLPEPGPGLAPALLRATPASGAAASKGSQSSRWAEDRRGLVARSGIERRSRCYRETLSRSSRMGSQVRTTSRISPSKLKALA